MKVEKILKATSMIENGPFLAEDFSRFVMAFFLVQNSSSANFRKLSPWSNVPIDLLKQCIIFPSVTSLSPRGKAKQSKISPGLLGNLTVFVIKNNLEQ